MSFDNFTFQSLRNVDEIEQNLELIRIVFMEETGVDRLVRKLIDLHPDVTLQDFLVAKHEGRIVASLCLIPAKWSIGEIPLKVAMMGAVATLPEYRRKGLVRRLVGEFHDRVKVESYDLAAIEGIPYFYRQFGYEYAIPLLEETKIRLDHVPRNESRYIVRPFLESDIPQASLLLEQSQKKFYVHTVRDRKIWEIQQKTGIGSEPEPFEAYVVEEDGEMVAYFRMRENPTEKELILTEITDVDKKVARAVLTFLKKSGLERGLKQLSANISYQEPFAEYLVSLGGSQRIPPYAWQVRVTDYVKMFLKLKPLLETRLAASGFRGLTERLSLDFRLFTVEIEVVDGEILDVRRLDVGERSPLGFNPIAFMQLLFGYRSRHELEMCFPDFRIDPSYRPLVDILFPKLPSYIHSAY